MDKQILKTKLKKYLFFVSVVFLSITSIHLIYSFIYFDSKEVPQKGGTISESFIGKLPSLNPLKFNNDYNAYINHILYRSLLSYDINNKKITGDLATCDIKNTKNIKCDINPNSKWSSGESITSDDIISTYETIKKYNTNPVIKSILDNITITSSDSSILFKSNINDVNILNILFQPIMPKIVLDKIDEKNLKNPISPIDGIYSGKYKITKIDQDETAGFKKIFLEKNSYYTDNNIYINNIILKFYKDYPSLLKQKESINIFNDKKNLIGESIPKLKSHKYILPQYIGVFINKDKLEYPNIRNYILTNINSENIVKELGETNNKVITSPFLDNINLNIKQSNTTLKTMLNSLGYYKKDYYLSKLSETNIVTEIKKISPEAKIKNKENITQTGIILEKDKIEIDITKIKNSITKQNYNSKSKTIIKPEWVDKYNFIRNPEILLEGVSNKNISEIYINDYKLKNYKPESNKFFYKLSPKIGNIKLGENNYKIYFIKNGKKEFIEEITFFYNKNKQNLEKKEAELITKLINEKILEEKEKLEKNRKIETKNKEKIIQNNSTKIKILNSEEIKRKNLIKALDENFYYDKDFNPYKLNLTYIIGSKQIEKTAIVIKKQLEKSGIQIDLNSIKKQDLQKQLKNNTEKYNILLSGINLGYFNFNLSKHFYSGQIEKGLNFSKIRGSKFDSLLEDLKSIDVNNKKKILELEKSVIKTFESENIFKPLYSPYYSNLVLKNIEGYNLSENIPNSIYRFDPLVKSYILKEKIINDEGKNLLGFIKYLINNLF